MCARREEKVSLKHVTISFGRIMYKISNEINSILRKTARLPILSGRFTKLQLNMASQEDIYERVAEKFGLNELSLLQKQTTDAIGEGKDILVCSKTGSGKSVMFQQTIIVKEMLNNYSDISHVSACASYSTSRDVGPVEQEVKCVIVLVPLLAVMKEHVQKLNSIGYKATYIGRDPTEIPDIKAGKFEFLYGAPEDLVGKDEWRSTLSSDLFRSKVIAIVVDEAHSVVNWGEAHKAGEDAFREWFSKIGELRSLCPKSQLIAVTATASPSKRKRIMKLLAMNQLTTCVIVDSPDRKNIKLFLKRIKATDDLSETFGWLIEKIQSLELQSEDFNRHIIFCKTIRDCAQVYRLLHDVDKTKQCVQMYHSKTVTSVQDHIRQDMDASDGNIRVLVCTNAAGMGVNFAGVNDVINFGPPNEIDTLLQQMGRAGRDGSQARHLLLYHGRQLKNCETSILEYLTNKDSCRRKCLLQCYGTSVQSQSLPGHLCCDICTDKCQCETESCESLVPHHFLEFKANAAEEQDIITYRLSNPDQRDQLKRLLLEYRHSINYGGDKSCSLISGDVIHGFSVDIIDKIVDRCDGLNTPLDIIMQCEVMSYSIAQAVCDIFEIVFPGSVFQGDNDESDEENDDLFLTE